MASLILALLEKVLETVFEKVAKLKKYKYEAPCIVRWRSFAPLVYLVYRIACKEVNELKKRAMLLMAMKHDRCHGKMVGSSRVRMLLAVICLNTIIL